MAFPTLALWAVNLARPVASLDEWLAEVDRRLAACRREGVDLLVLPEYCSNHWLAFAPPAGRIAWEAEVALAAVPPLAAIAAAHGVALLAGTTPFRHPGGRITNRARLFLPPEPGAPARLVEQDKLCLTPPERDPMGIAPGDVLHVVEWRGLRLAVLTCLDIELPALAALLGERLLDLVLVPSMTHRPAGYHRVFGCAKARAVELQAIVAAVGVVGTLADGTTHHSGAAVFVPCEEILGHSGVHAALGPLGDPGPGEDPSGPMLIARDLPVAAVRALRAGAAEVWPGAWRADAVRIVED